MIRYFHQSLLMESTTERVGGSVMVIAGAPGVEIGELPGVVDDPVDGVADAAGDGLGGGVDLGAGVGVGGAIEVTAICVSLLAASVRI